MSCSLAAKYAAINRIKEFLNPEKLGGQLLFREDLCAASGSCWASLFRQQSEAYVRKQAFFSIVCSQDLSHADWIALDDECVSEISHDHNRPRKQRDRFQQGLQDRTAVSICLALAEVSEGPVPTKLAAYFLSS